MKKLTFVALAAAAIIAGSCGQKTPSANLKTEADTLAYAIGMAQSEGLKQAIAQNGIDSTQMNSFTKGFLEGAKISADDKEKAAYMFGIQMGQIVSQRMIPGINQEVYGADSTKTLSLENMVAGILSGVNGEKGIMTAQEAQGVAELLMKKLKEEANKEVIAASNAFVEKYAKEPGVKQLGTTGIYYKVIKEGNGAKPTAESQVTVNYEGKNMKGKVFDSSYERKEPAKMAVTQVIQGWQEVLKAMPVGSTWECVIPQNLAYGERQAGPDVPAYSALKFKVELISIDK
ncbi:MAG: FKBP-type peptidyl-prolyl cis-trans isomerase [Bacteroidaceae bacterium]|nr:FKBP-type peptidyl-prolyl cis-trans isomerase [Bacteroidaceae bacterium]